MAPKKPRSGKKQSKKEKPAMVTNEFESEIVDEEISPRIARKTVRPVKRTTDQYDDNISLYEEENVDLLDTIEGVGYEEEEFQKQYPHITDEMGDPNRSYPVDSVRWEEDELVEEEVLPPEEPTLDSLLSRSKSEEEALEIIKYLEKQGQVTPQDAKKLISTLKTEGLQAFKRRKK